MPPTKTLGIVAHSAEGAALCFLTACHHAEPALGPFMHPTIVLSAVPMGLSMPAWEAGNHAEVGRHLAEGVRLVARAGAEFYICPDNTAHIVLEQIAGRLPIPGLHIAEVVAAEVSRQGWKTAGLLGTKWTMTGSVYERALSARGIDRVIPDESMRERVNGAIFADLCRGVVTARTTGLFVEAVEVLRAGGAQCVILGCTEIPMVLRPENSPLPPVDSTRLLARRAVDLCTDRKALRPREGWLVV